MRKITIETAEALRNGENITIDNTEVKNGVMNLFGNTIAIYDSIEGKLTIRDSGYKTNTTKERLNGILDVFGSKWRIYQYQGLWRYTDGMGISHLWEGFLVVEDI